MNSEAIHKIENTVFLLVEQWLNVALRRCYLNELLEKQFTKDTRLDEIDAVIGLQTILLMDFFHSLTSLTFEQDKGAVSVFRTFEVINTDFAKDFLLQRWSDLGHEIVPAGPEVDVSIFHEPLRDRDIKAFGMLYEEVINLGKAIFNNESKYLVLKNIRDKITAHREFRSEGGRVRMVSFRDINATIQDAFDLYNQLEILIPKAYLLLTNGHYRTTKVIDHQRTMARCLSMRLPFVF
jgi:hypothetical protein